MALYEYRCPAFGQGYETLLPMNGSDNPTKCPECGVTGEKLISVFASTHEGSVKVPDKDPLRGS